jgi:hypothetical protein
MTPKAEALHYGWKKYLKQLDQLLVLEQKAKEKWDSLPPMKSEDDEVDELISGLNMIEIGGKKVPADDFNDLIHRMQNQVPCEDIWKLLGTYKESYNGDLMLEFLKTTMTEQEGRGRFFILIFRIFELSLHTWIHKTSFFYWYRQSIHHLDVLSMENIGC